MSNFLLSAPLSSPFDGMPMIVFFIFCFIAYAAFNIISNCIFACYSKTIKIYLRKSHKYDSKVDPIYKLAYTWDDWHIEKYALQWTSIESLNILIYILCPIPFEIKGWRYEMVNKHPIDYASIEHEINDLCAKYEELDAIDNAEYNKRLSKTQKIEQKIENLNKTYTENYE